MRNLYAAAIIAATTSAQQAFEVENSNHGLIDLTETNSGY